MNSAFRSFLALAVAVLAGVSTASAQKQGGVLRIYHRDSPASMSIHEEGTVGVIMPMMGVFNNLVLFDQHVPQNSLDTIRPELATSWASSEALSSSATASNGTTANRLVPRTSNAPSTC